MSQVFQRSSVDAINKMQAATNPTLTQEWIHCKEEIAYLETRALQYHEDGDDEALADVLFLLEIERADCKALECAGAAPTMIS